MVARLKLKGIDGRAPPGVNIAARRSVSALKREPERVGTSLVHLMGDILKLRETPKASTTKPIDESHWWPG
jgi:hypothetical protein